LSRHALAVILTQCLIAAGLALAQQPRQTITALFTEVPLRTVLASLQSRFQVQFSFLEHNVAGKVITASLEDKTLSEAAGKTAPACRRIIRWMSSWKSDGRSDG
jgi:hypothetical protein